MNPREIIAELRRAATCSDPWGAVGMRALTYVCTRYTRDGSIASMPWGDCRWLFLLVAEAMEADL